MTWNLYNEDWRKVPFRYNTPTVVISDPPYDARTHAGRETGSKESEKIKYPPLTQQMAAQVVDNFLVDEPNWWVFFCSHVTYGWFAEVLERNGQYVFAPVGWAKPDPMPRKQGDGPDSSIEWLCIARPKKRLRRYGHRPGHYFENTCSTRGQGFQGQKPLNLMQRIVCDYSEPNDIVVDPFAGSGTTLLAAVMNGRHAWGCEVDTKTYKAARMRLEEHDKQIIMPLPVAKKKPKQILLTGVQ